MHTLSLFVGLCLVERGPQEALELGFEVVPGGVDALETLAAGDDDAAAAEDEHDDGGVLGAVDEAREHAALERALDVVLLVEELEVDAVVLEVHVDVPDDVLDLNDAALEVDARDGPAEDGDDLVRGEDAEQEVAAAGEDHFPGGEEEHGAVRVEEADGDGGEFFLFKCAVGEDAVDELEVEREAAAEHLGGADDVVYHDRGARGRGARVLWGRVVEVDVPGDAVGRHRRVMDDAAAAAHGGDDAGEATHVLTSFKKKRMI